MKKDIREIKRKIVERLNSCGAKKIMLFGSYAKGTARPGSDIDLIVEFRDKNKSLLEFVRIERELSEEIGIPVDLLTESSISPYLIDRIREEAVVIS